jgi:multidrug efflux pump
MGLAAPGATLLVAVATLLLTVVLYILIPKGFFPVQDTGVILGISEAAQTVSFNAMADRQQVLAQAILRDPAVESLSSFVGIDGPMRRSTAEEFRSTSSLWINEASPRAMLCDGCSRSLREIEGITLYMQPVQELTVEDRLSRTQYQYSLEDPDPDELDKWVPQFVRKLQSLPELREWPATSRIEDCRPVWSSIVRRREGSVLHPKWWTMRCMTRSGSVRCPRCSLS